MNPKTVVRKQEFILIFMGDRSESKKAVDHSFHN